MNSKLLTTTKSNQSPLFSELTMVLGYADSHQMTSLADFFPSVLIAKELMKHPKLKLLEEIFQGMTEVTMTFLKRTILVMDDEPDYLTMICLVLEKKGFVTLKAHNGQQAMKQVRQMPDLILLDVRMTGGLSGFDVCQQLKTDIRYQHIPIIFCSALASEKDIERGLKAGAVEYLTKPFNLDRLVMLMTHYIQDYHFSNKGSE